MAEVNRPNVSEIASGRWLVHTLCHECFIDVEASDNNPEWRWFSVGLLSTHDGEWSGRLRTRIRYAWDVLRGRGRSIFDLNTLEETDNLIWTLYEARRRAFDAPIPTITLPLELLNDTLPIEKPSP